MMKKTFTRRYYTLLHSVMTDLSAFFKIFSDRTSLSLEKLAQGILCEITYTTKAVIDLNPSDIELILMGHGIVMSPLGRYLIDQPHSDIFNYERANYFYNSKEGIETYRKAYHQLKDLIPKAINKNQLPTGTDVNFPFLYLLQSLPEAQTLLDKYASVLYSFINALIKADGTVSASEVKILQDFHMKLYKRPDDSLTINLFGSDSIPNEFSLKNDLNEFSLKKELNEFIGLENVKNEITTLYNFLKIQEIRKEQGLPLSSISYHMVFTGNPGTGKTTMARLVARVFKALGILEKGHLVETDRSGLIAEYLGQTSNKVNDIIDSAIGGVLFIDEAYALVSEDGNDSYGEEAVATLIKRMEDNRKELVVIMAGYTDEMKEFIDTNPGLESRINRHIDFPDYPPDELFQIFELYCKKADYIMTMDAKSKLHINFIHDFELRDKSFGNGRLVRNIFEQTIENQSNRIAHYPELDKEILMTLEESDVPSSTYR